MTSLLLATADIDTMLLMRLAEVDRTDHTLLCHLVMDQVAAVRSSAMHSPSLHQADLVMLSLMDLAAAVLCPVMHTPSLLDVGASQNMPLFDTHLHQGSWLSLPTTVKILSIFRYA
jgi:hypothetical protein